MIEGERGREQGRNRGREGGMDRWKVLGSSPTHISAMRANPAATTIGPPCQLKLQRMPINDFLLINVRACVRASIMKRCTGSTHTHTHTYCKYVCKSVSRTRTDESGKTREALTHAHTHTHARTLWSRVCKPRRQLVGQ